ncbi:hypothetical protein ACE7GA_15830 [Roseomonas sp. CCTCC AB2023176]|uniref:hypothetical protein n=1 Tax=Roseomonas sp. CCTCC AB2023176 TaxID=3342640 RepID=UPI0035DFDEC1
MIRLLVLALPLSLAARWVLRRMGWEAGRAWTGGVGVSALLLGLLVVFGDVDDARGRLVLAALWLGVHAALYLLLRPFLGRVA